METPNYIAHIRAVADRHGKPSLEDLYVLMSQCWEKIEWMAKGMYPQHDILAIGIGVELFEEMVKFLYQVDPNATAGQDCEVIYQKDREYGGSWHRRGGVGAFFMLCRKWDRLVEGVKNHKSFTLLVQDDHRTEGVLDDIGDLRRYLILVLAWHAARNAEENPQQDIEF